MADQRIGDVGIEHDGVGRDEEDAGDDALAVGDVPHVDLEEFLVSAAILEDEKKTNHEPKI